MEDFSEIFFKIKTNFFTDKGANKERKVKIIKHEKEKNIKKYYEY